MIETKIITAERKQDLLLKNDPFPIWGRMIPSYIDQKWSYSVEEFPAEKSSEMCFPEESYDFDAMSGDTVFIGAYENGKCVGLIVLQKGFFKYQFVPDFKVSASHRRQGVGSLLIAKAAQIAKENGYRGLYLQGQDNNLSACLFYLHNGFRIGGLDTEVYRGTSQEGKADTIFYLDT